MGGASYGGPTYSVLVDLRAAADGCRQPRPVDVVSWASSHPSSLEYSYHYSIPVGTGHSG
jgi:hypothetical protein